MIQCKEMAFGYGKKPVYKGFNWELQAGSICGLLGANGAGKSTLFKLLTGLMFPDQGEVRVLGYLTKNREADLYKKMSYVGEDLSCPNMSPVDYVNLIGPLYPRFSADDFHSLCQLFEVNATKKFSEFSAGDLRKAWLSIVLSYKTELILLDEPSKGLDINAQSALRKALSQLAAEGSCILLSTHHVREFEGLLDHITIIDRQGTLKLNSGVEDLHEIFSLHHCLSKDQIPSDALAYQRTPNGWTALINKASDSYVEIPVEFIFKALCGSRKEDEHVD